MPLGGRFLEIHVVCEPEKVLFHDERFLERGYFDEALGHFECADEKLNRIWQAGVETLRACTEDALVDNPTRERGQWTGDVLTSQETMSAAFNDFRLARRALVQAAQSADASGLVSALSPAGHVPIPSYAAQWVAMCVRYHELSGDISLLEDMLDAACLNLQAFAPQVAEDGLHDVPGWNFIDWGYVRGEEAVEIALNLHYLEALRAMATWCARLDKTTLEKDYQTQAEHLTSCLNAILKNHFSSERLEDAAASFGFHAAALALRLGFFTEPRFSKETLRSVVSRIKQHMMQCFPNDANAPMLSDPSAATPRAITPFFGHFALSVLLEQGEDDFVFDQFRNCWGWMLQNGRTTCLEVFDTRWSHCHAWSTCPTWQLSQFVLGLRRRFDLGENHFGFNLHIGALQSATGRVPLQNGIAEISWRCEDAEIIYNVKSAQRLWLHCNQPNQDDEIIDIAPETLFTLRLAKP